MLKTESTLAKSKIGLSLGPASGEPVATFACGSTAVVLRGSVIAEAKANNMAVSTNLVMAQKKGVQKWKSFEGAPQATLEVQVGSHASEVAALTLSTVQTSDEKVEINGLYQRLARASLELKDRQSAPLAASRRCRAPAAESGLSDSMTASARRRSHYCEGAETFSVSIVLKGKEDGLPLTAALVG